jgi:hypothetical protein
MFCGVIVTGAFLAEAASAVDNKLNVTGGVLSRVAVGPDRSARFVLVVLTQAETGNSDNRVEVEIRPPTGDQPVRMEFEVPEVSIAEFPGFAFFEITIDLPVDGLWVLVVSGGMGAMSLPLSVSAWTPQAL